MVEAAIAFLRHQFIEGCASLVVQKTRETFMEKEFS
jgi:hypothetical protein